jgi:alpha-L-arabinofuranosidase
VPNPQKNTAVLSDDGKSHTLSLVNKNLTEPLETTLSLSGFAQMKIEQCIALEGAALDTVNTADSSPVLPIIDRTDCRIVTDALEISLPAASWHMVRIRIV